jgi:hypothetical protein
MCHFLSFLDRRSGPVLIVLSLVFLALETFYALHRPLNPDEFSGAWSVVQAVTHVPYVDFDPYKPVLGYYLQYLLLQLGTDPWDGYLTVRIGITYLAVLTLLLGALWLRRFYRPAAVCLAFATVGVMTSLAEWLIDFRLDMLTALFGFVSLLCLLDRRIALAGLLAGFSFLVSQKGAVYGLAGGAGLLGCLLIQRDRRFCRDAMRFAACVALPIAVYVAFWSLIAPLSTILQATFGQATQLHALTSSMRQERNFYWYFWLQTLLRNPLFYLYALWALAILLRRGRAQNAQETLLLFYSLTVAIIMVGIRQPWAYMFVLLVPTAFVLHADLFSRKLNEPESVLHRPVAWASFVVLGLLLPLSRVPVVARDDPGGQRQTLELAHALLQPGDRYFAGIQLLYRSEAHEKAVGMVDIFSFNPIDLRPTDQHLAMLERFKKEPIRFVLYTGIIDISAPEVIRKHVQRNYAPLWANVWIYAPQFGPADSRGKLLFSGDYMIETETPGLVRIDGQTCASGQTIALQQGRHTIDSTVRFRVKLQPPDIDHLLKPAYCEPILFFWPDGIVPAPPHYSTGVWVDP